MKCFYSADAPERLQLHQLQESGFDKLIDEAGATDDLAKRIDLLKKANGIAAMKKPRSGSSTTTRQ